MPRRSAEHIALDPFLTGGNRLHPPVHLSATERAIWLEVVGAVPVEHFLPEDAHLLEALCAAVMQQRQATANLARDPGNRDRGYRIYWNEQFNIAVKSMRTLSIALRLGPVSRHPVNRKRAALGKAASAYELFGDDMFDSATDGARTFDDLRELRSKEENADEEG